FPYICFAVSCMFLCLLFCLECHMCSIDFPYTALFRSFRLGESDFSWQPLPWRPVPRVLAHPADPWGSGHYRVIQPFEALKAAGRSEEHTSELQSRENLVCRLLLEKKKTFDLSLIGFLL